MWQIQNWVLPLAVYHVVCLMTNVPRLFVPVLFLYGMNAKLACDAGQMVVAGVQVASVDAF